MKLLVPMKKNFKVGVLLDSKLKFDSHITSPCKKVGEKLRAKQQKITSKKAYIKKC